MTQIITYKKQVIHDVRYCIGCTGVVRVYEGQRYEGGCDCHGDELFYCRCSKGYTVREPENDKWRCSLYDKDLNTGEIPLRCDICKEINSTHNASVVNRESIIDLQKKEIFDNTAKIKELEAHIEKKNLQLAKIRKGPAQYKWRNLIDALLND